MRIINILTIVILVQVSLLTSCIKKYQGFDINSEAQLIAPIAYGDFVLGDIIEGINEDSLFQTGSNNELIFTYREENIASINFNELINIPTSIQIVEEEKFIGDIELKPYSFSEVLTIQDLKQRLPNNKIIRQLPENGNSIFPEIILEKELSNELSFEIQDFDFLQSGHFVDGELTCVFKNDFPTNCSVQYQIIDDDGGFVEDVEFGFNNSTGLEAHETEVKVIDLKGKAIKAPLFYKIVYLHLYESENQVYIQPSNSLRINAELTNMVVDEGTISSESFQYKTEPEQVQFDIGDTLFLTRAIIDEAILQIEMRKTFLPNGELSIYFPYLFKDGLPYEIKIPLSNNNSRILTFDLAGTELLLSNEVYDYNSIEFYIEFVCSDDEELLEFKADDSFKFGFSLLDVSFSYLEGDFGNIKLDLSETGLGIDADLWDNISGEFFGEDPILKLIFNNPVGMPMLFDVQIDAYNLLNERVSLSADPFILKYPENRLEAPIVSEIEFNSSNSAINSFMSLPPNNTVNFFASIELNPRRQEEEQFSNFVLLTEPFQVGLEIEAPLLLSGASFSFTDTIPLNTRNLDELVEKAEIIFNTQNSMPLQVDLRVFPFDSISKTKTGEELFVTLLEASEVDDLGNVTKAADAENSLLINSDAIHSLSIANSLLINASFISPDNGESPAKLKSEYGFEMKVILDVKPNL